MQIRSFLLVLENSWNKSLVSKINLQHASRVSLPGQRFDAHNEAPSMMKWGLAHFLLLFLEVCSIWVC